MKQQVVVILENPQNAALREIYRNSGIEGAILHPPVHYRFTTYCAPGVGDEIAVNLGEANDRILQVTKRRWIAMQHGDAEQTILQLEGTLLS